MKPQIFGLAEMLETSWFTMKQMVRNTRQKAIDPLPNPDKRESFGISEGYSHIKIRISDTEEEITAFLAYDSAIEDGVMVGDKDRLIIFCAIFLFCFIFQGQCEIIVFLEGKSMTVKFHSPLYLVDEKWF